MTVSRLPLDGIRVIDFSRVLAGPLCSALLGDLGADVIKIEPPGGDDYRAIGPFARGESGLFSAMNRNKRSVVIDLKTEDGQMLAQSLCAQADVVVENFRPGVAGRLGIGYETLSARNPALVYASVSGFGQTGPESHRPAYDIILQALCGLMDATGAPDGEPTLVGDSVSDVVSGIFASWGVLAALVARDRTGKGTHVDVSMFDATLSLTATLVARYATTGVTQSARRQSSSDLGAVRRVSRVGRPLRRRGAQQQAVRPPRRCDRPSRTRRRSALRERHLALRTRSRTARVHRAMGSDALGRRSQCALSDAGIPVAPIQNIQQALDSEHARTRGVLVDTVAADGSTVRVPAQPLKFSAYPKPARRARRASANTPRRSSKTCSASTRQRSPRSPRAGVVHIGEARHRSRRKILLKRLGVTDADLEIADAIRRFAQAELAPHAAQVDREEISTTRYVRALAELGVMGMNLPERWNGIGASPAAIILALVEIAKACAATSSMIGAHYLATDSILIGGSDALRDRYLPEAATGVKLGAFALTEPQAGSNPAGMTTQALRDGDSYHIRGVKHFISNADAAQFIVVYAKTVARTRHARHQRVRGRSRHAGRDRIARRKS